MISDVKSSRPLWPRRGHFDLGLGLGLKPQTFGLGLASSLSYYVIGQFSGILLIFPAIILNHMLLIIIWYFFVIIFGLSLGLNL